MSFKTTCCSPTSISVVGITDFRSYSSPGCAVLCRLFAVVSSTGIGVLRPRVFDLWPVAAAMEACRAVLPWCGLALARRGWEWRRGGLGGRHAASASVSGVGSVGRRTACRAATCATWRRSIRRDRLERLCKRLGAQRGGGGAAGGWNEDGVDGGDGCVPEGRGDPEARVT